MILGSQGNSVHSQQQHFYPNVALQVPGRSRYNFITLKKQINVTLSPINTCVKASTFCQILEPKLERCRLHVAVPCFYEMGLDPPFSGFGATGGYGPNTEKKNEVQTYFCRSRVLYKRVSAPTQIKIWARS